MMKHSDQLANQLREMHRLLSAEGSLPSRAQLASYYNTFQRRFGPQVLRALDGEELLETMHAHGNHDSLVYWLEFKNDEEQPAIFGSIAGGSALKFGIFRKAETGAWMGRNPSNYPIEISLDQAITSARKHRDQLVAGVELLANLPTRGTDADYQTLQREMDQRAPDVSNLAWGHK